MNKSQWAGALGTLAILVRLTTYLQSFYDEKRECQLPSLGVALSLFGTLACYDRPSTWAIRLRSSSGIGTFCSWL